MLHRARRAQHVSVHEKEIHPRAIAVLAWPPGVALLVALTGLPADAAQGIALGLGQVVPSVA